MRHRVDIDSSVNRGPGSRYAYRASCPCGWVGRQWNSYAAAESDGDQHVLAAVDDDEEGGHR